MGSYCVYDNFVFEKIRVNPVQPKKDFFIAVLSYPIHLFD